MSEPAPLALLLEGPAADAEAWLAAWGFEAPGPARRALQALFRAVRDPAFALRFLDALLERLRVCPDPDRALNHLERWVAQLASVRDALATLTGDLRLFDDLLLLFGTSDYLADILVREPTAYTLLLPAASSPQGEAPAVGATDLRARLDAAVDLFPRTLSRLDALRRFKRREFLRIAWRDLTGRDDFATVVRAISDLTDALIAKALAVCQADLAARDATGRPAPPFAVVAMGKLGARELNYSSDVDLLFVCDVDADDDRGLRQATRLAEELVAALSRPTAEGHLFRVDMRLRPEGRYGALVRSLASYREYYDHWVETWERQALLKARFVAGDPALGERFERMIEPHVYRRVLSTALFEDVRDVKLAIERRVDDAGQTHTNVKEGRGTIRDIEFAVQLLQLLFGGERPELRVRATLPAIERLAAAGLLTPEEAGSLADHYRFFRTVEHRLQLMSDLPVRLLPETPGEQRKLARRMGYSPDESGRFMADYAARAEAVRQITGELVDRLANPTGRRGAHAERSEVGLATGRRGEGTGSALRALVLEVGHEPEQGDDPSSFAPSPARPVAPSRRTALAAELERLGFLEPAGDGRLPAAVETVARLARGGPHVTLPMSTRRVFAELAETLLPRAGASPDPEGALRAIESLARRMGTYQTFYRTLAEQPDMVELLCVVPGTSPWVAEEITRRPELMDALTDPEFVRQPRSAEALLEEARRRRDAARGAGARRNALRRFKKRELLRIAARDLHLGIAPREVAAELAHLADACLRVGLEIAQETLFPDRAAPPGGFAVIGLGRLGGEELHYSSDLDLLHLYDPRREAGSPLQHSQYEALAAELSGVMQQVMEEGRLYEIDLRLRPEGKSGLMLAHLDAARQYYGAGGRSQTWEKQSLIKARFVAGDERLAEEFLALVRPEVYPQDPPAGRDAEVRAMKRRIETERVASAERERNVKLGPGGLSDVEFLVQFLQLRHGGRHPSLRVRNTWAALAALAAEAILPAADVETLVAHYDFLTRLRQRLYLRSAGVATDLLPTDPLEQRRLARTMGLPDGAALLAEYTRRTREVRALFTRYLLETTGGRG